MQFDLCAAQAGETKSPVNHAREKTMTVIYLASDHGGTLLKDQIREHLEQAGFEVSDLGTNGSVSVDYPDYAARLAEAMLTNAEAKGILICGSGIGISIAANRFSHIRAALVTDVSAARLSRQHNDANVLALGERLTGVVTALDCVDAFLSTDFEAGRHQRRVDKLSSPQPLHLEKRLIMNQMDGFFSNTLSQTDPQIAAALRMRWCVSKIRLK